MTFFTLQSCVEEYLSGSKEDDLHKVINILLAVTGAIAQHQSEKSQRKEGK